MPWIAYFKASDNWLIPGRPGRLATSAIPWLRASGLSEGQSDSFGDSRDTRVSEAADGCELFADVLGRPGLLDQVGEGRCLLVDFELQLHAATAEPRAAPSATWQ